MSDQTPPDDREMPSDGSSSTPALSTERDPEVQLLAASETETDREAEGGESVEDPEAPSEDSAEIPEDLVVGEGKTLSDYLEDEPEKSKADAAPEFRAIPNVEKLVVPPPGGVARPKDGSGGAPARDRGPKERGPRQGSRGPKRSSESTTGASGRAGVPGTPGAAITTTAARMKKAGSSARAAAAAAGADAGGAEEGESFGDMFESSVKAKSYDSGETVKGVIVALGPEVAFLDIGGKSEATIDISELKDDEGDIEVEVGDTIEATIVSTEGGLKLSRKLARGSAAKEQLADAFSAGLPVEGRVEKAIKGGYEIRIAGQRAFCPISQIDSARTADPAVHVGKVLTFRIIEFKEGGKNLVVSRRAILAEEDKARAAEAKKSIVPDAVLKGRVVSVREYGAFVDLGGVQGLLHVSEMGWSRVSNPSEVLKPGDEITVKVLKIDDAKGRISLGLKQLQADPWSTVSEAFTVGQVLPGKIVRLQDFGAFVELAPGIEGLAHVSTFAPTGTADGWKKTAPAGTTASFEILTIDPERKRIGVAMVEEGSTRASRAAAGAAASAGGSGATSEAGSGGGSGGGEETAAASGRASGALSGRASNAPSGGESRASRGPSSGAPSAPKISIVPGARLKGRVERHESYGVFIFLAPGRTGLMPLGESATSRGTDMKKAFPVGSEVEVAVLELEPGGKRIRLSRKALIDAEERDDAREFTERRTGKSQESFGSIGDKLRAALEGKTK